MDKSTNKNVTTIILGERVESESRIAKIYGLKCPGFNKNCKTWKKTKVWFILWEKKKSAEIVSDFPQVLELTDEYFFLFELTDEYFKLVIINMLK